MIEVYKGLFIGDYLVGDCCQWERDIFGSRIGLSETNYISARYKLDFIYLLNVKILVHIFSKKIKLNLKKIFTLEILFYKINLRKKN